MNENFFKLKSDVEIFFKRIAGDKQKPVLVFLHEGLGCIDMWKKFPEQLCSELGFPGLVFDRQGYGQSSPLDKSRTARYLHEYALDELPKVISGLIPGRKFFLIGHSDGGTIALIYSSKHKENLLGIILEAAHISVEEKALAGIRKAIEAYKNGKLDSLKKYHGEKTEAVFQAWADTWLSESFHSWNISDCLGSIACPVFIIQGKDDHYATADQVKMISEGVPFPRILMVDNCGHSPHLEKRELMVSGMSQFIREQLSAMA